MFQIFLGGDFRERYGLWEELQGVYMPLATCSGNVTLYTPVMLHGGADVPTFFTVVTPGGTLIGLEVDNHFGPGGCKWCLVEIEIAMQVGIRRQFGIDSR